MVCSFPSTVSSNIINNMSQSVKIGISGFAYEDWAASGPPETIQSASRLNSYANELGFDVIELSHTHKNMPKAKEMGKLLECVPMGFGFVPKLHSSLTQRIRESDGSFVRNEVAVSSFLRGIDPLVEHKSLICVLAQFPIKFKRSQGAENHLKWLCEAMGRNKLAVELQGTSWMAQSVFDMLNEHDISYCISDTPDIPRLAPFNPVVTSSIAYIRLHGKNMKWFDGAAKERHDYLYSDSELRGLLDPLKQVSSKAEKTIMIFNNYYNGSSLKNAIQMKRIVGDSTTKNSNNTNE